MWFGCETAGAYPGRSFLKPPRLLGAPDRQAARRVQAAMMQMGKIDIAALETAFHAG